jgi:hypothetical protein
MKFSADTDAGSWRLGYVRNSFIPLIIMNKIISLAAGFAATYGILRVLQRPAQVDGPVPGIDPMGPLKAAAIATAMHALTAQFAGK